MLVEDECRHFTFRFISHVTLPPVLGRRRFVGRSRLLRDDGVARCRVGAYFVSHEVLGCGTVLRIANIRLLRGIRMPPQAVAKLF